MPGESFTPSECLALLAVFSDAAREVELLLGIGKRNFPSSTSLTTGQSVQDTLLTELNKIFFQTLLRYENAREEDYFELPDGTYRKLNDEESTRVKYTEIVARVSDTLKKVLLELDEKGTFGPLIEYNEREQSEVDKVINFVEAASNKDKELGKLQDSISQLKRNIRQEHVELSETLEHLKHEFQELREMAKMTLQYKKKEYSAKLHNQINNRNEVLRLENTELERIKTLIVQATRVGEETASWMYSDIATKVHLANLLPLNQKPANLAQQLVQKRKELEEHEALHKKLQEEFEECTRILQAYEKETESKRLRDEYATKVMLSVIQIQSWWRTMIASRGIRIKRKKKKGNKRGKKVPQT